MGRYELTVGGMQCIGCERIIEHELERMEEVTQATADHRAGFVECATNGPIEERVIETIEELGYDVTE